jgi:hypothetical protein
MAKREKLCDLEVLAMRDMYASKECTYRALARIFDVAYFTVYNAVNKVTWAWL